MYIYGCVYKSMYVFVYTRMWAYTRVFILYHTCVSIYICHVCVCVLITLPLYVWFHVTVISDSFVQSELDNERFELCSSWIRYTGDSKTDS